MPAIGAAWGDRNQIVQRFLNDQRGKTGRRAPGAMREGWRRPSISDRDRHGGDGEGLRKLREVRCARRSWSRHGQRHGQALVQGGTAGTRVPPRLPG